MSAAATLPEVRPGHHRVEWNGKTYYVVPRVPVFQEHDITRYVRDPSGNVLRNPDGTPKTERVKVDRKNLEDTVAHRRRAERGGRYALLTTGHRKLDPETPENEQPPPKGHLREPVLAEDDEGRLTVYMDEWVEAAHYEDVLTYPNPSAEYYQGSREITAVAMLRRDGQLPLGPVFYSQDRGLCYHYAMEGPMPEEMAGDPSLPPDAHTPTEPPVPGEDNNGKVVEYLKGIMPHLHAIASHPHHMHMAQQYGAGPAMASPTNVSMPAATPPPPMPPDASGKYAVEALATNYARLERMVTELQGQVKDALGTAKTWQEKAVRSDAESRVNQLQSEGFVFKDHVKDGKAVLGSGKAREVERFMKLSDDAARDERMEEIRTNYERDPASLSGTVPSVGDDALNAAHDRRDGARFGGSKQTLAKQTKILEAAQQYMRGGMTWSDAEKKAEAEVNGAA